VPKVRIRDEWHGDGYAVSSTDDRYAVSSTDDGYA
jgi:hypothetical protein